MPHTGDDFATDVAECTEWFKEHKCAGVLYALILIPAFPILMALAIILYPPKAIMLLLEDWEFRTPFTIFWTIAYYGFPFLYVFVFSSGGQFAALLTLIGFSLASSYLPQLYGLFLRSKEDDDWNRVENPSETVRFTIPNLAALSAIIMEPIQVVAIIFAPAQRADDHIGSVEDTLYSDISQVLKYVTLIDWEHNLYFTVFWVCVGLVALLLILLLVPTISHIRGVKTIVGVLIVLLTDTLFIPIFRTLSGMLSCTYNDGDRVYLTNDEDVTCWEGAHRGYAIVASMFVLYYGNFGTVAFADTDEDEATRIFQDPALDIKYPQTFLIYDRLLRVLLTSISTFLSHRIHFQIGSAAFYSFMKLGYIIYFQPCCVPSINHVRAVNQILSIWASFSTMLFVLLTPKFSSWSSILLMIIGWVVIAVSACLLWLRHIPTRRARSLGRSAQSNKSYEMHSVGLRS